MAGEVSPAGRPGSSELRASHSDRDTVVEQLRIAAGDGRLTPEELDERLEAALTAKTYAELAALTADLPESGRPAAAAPAQAKDLVRFDQRGSSTTRSGRWVVPASIEARVVGGNVTLDFTEAVITYPTLPIEAEVRGGNLVLVVRPGITVDADDLSVIGGTVRFRRGTDQPAPVRLRVALSGRVKGGSVVVRLPRRTFWQWLTRQPRPYA
jgi:hypothetical protein